ncbi:MAG: UTP--glucose-1-phosphate uridylyltransferase [Proteobacteria bacterium]|nr:UTP--glucose-1-phosphate uridylyltransferase [Pseudomonadota bacterium]
MRNTVKKAVFPVAGLGTRFLPATKSVPKELLPVIDKPLLQYAIEEARAAGIEEFIFVTGPGKKSIEDYLAPAPELCAALRINGKEKLARQLENELPAAGQVSFAYQEQPLGLGHAILCARELVGDEPFAVLLVDDFIQGKVPCLEQLANVFAKTGGNVLAIEEVPLSEVHRYGVLDPGARNDNLVEINGLVEKLRPEDAPSNLTVVGRYILTPEVFTYLADQRAGAGGEIQLTDALARMIGKHSFHGLLFEGERFDCGNKQGFLEATIHTALGDPELRDWMTSKLKDL